MALLVNFSYNLFIIIKRDYYLNKLINKKQNHLIKVITGLRRVGKSFLLFNLFKSYLLSIGIESNHIIEIPLDIQSNQRLLNKERLLKYIKEKIIDNQQYFVLLDEIQYVKHFEPVLNELLRIENVDLYVTGSNCQFLSSDILTSLRGRCDQIHVYPLTFKEFVQAYDDINLAWKDYWKYGGLPTVVSTKSYPEKDEYLNNLFNVTYLNDILERYRIKHPEILSELINILSSNVGSYTNPTKISNTIFSVKKLKIKSSTIYRYIKYLEYAFIISKASRYDIKGKRYINALKKYYFEDIGLRNAYLKHRQDKKTHIYENIIFNNLKANGFNVDVGIVQDKTINKTKWLEVDFVANKADKTYYIQCCLTFNCEDPVSIKYRETRPYTKIKDSFEKFIVVGDEQELKVNEQGIKIIGIKEFLLNFFDK